MDSIEFVYIDSLDNPQFSKYNDIFDSSRVKEEPAIKPELKFEIDISKFEDILYKFTKSTSTSRIPLRDYPELNIIDNKIYFDNNFNWKQLLEYLQIDNITNNTHNSSSKSSSISLNNLIKHMKKESIALETKAIRKIIYPSLMLDMEVPIILALDNSSETPKVVGYLFFMEDDEKINIEVIEVNSSYRNSNLCKRLISYLIDIKPRIKKYSLVNVGGLAGYSCYMDAFTSLDFNGKIKRDKNRNNVNINDNDNINETNKNNENNSYNLTRKKQMNNLRLTIKHRGFKLNLSKMNNLEINKKFNGSMIFTK